MNCLVHIVVTFKTMVKGDAEICSGLVIKSQLFYDRSESGRIRDAFLLQTKS